VSRPVVTILGRPNVGKSSLFNRLLGRRKALVQDTPGVTRDRNYAIADLDGNDVILCDTGGFEEQGAVAGDLMARLIREQALVALDESDVLVFVMDVRAGLTTTDLDIAARLRKATQPVLWVLNKADHPSVDAELAEFYQLGVDAFWLVSAEHGRGMGELLDAIVEALPSGGDERGQVDEPWDERRERRPNRGSRKAEHGGRLHFLGEDMPSEHITRRGPAPEAWDPDFGDQPRDGQLEKGRVVDEDGVEVHYVGGGPDDLVFDDDGEVDISQIPDFEAPKDDSFVPRIAILGRPNVGKSTLLNRLLGYQRAITSPVAGTTHDSVDSFVEHDGQSFVLIDTAGIRRKARVHERVEQLTIGRSIRTVEAAHICLLLVDASEGVTEQEARLGRMIIDRGRALVIVVNKWDLADGRNARNEFMDQVRRRFPHLAYADTLFMSAKTGKGVRRIWDAVDRANKGHCMTVRTGPLNRWARGVWEANPPPMHKHRPVRLYYCVQRGIRPPTFVFFCNQPQALAESYRRYVTNQLRAAFEAPGTPLRLLFKDRSGS
jgi:GTPase